MKNKILGWAPKQNKNDVIAEKCYNAWFSDFEKHYIKLRDDRELPKQKETNKNHGN